MVLDARGLYLTEIKDVAAAGSGERKSMAERRCDKGCQYDPNRG
jgi:hypothetical protein